jgi:hypothetical protein
VSEASSYCGHGRECERCWECLTLDNIRLEDALRVSREGEERLTVERDGAVFVAQAKEVIELLSALVAKLRVQGLECCSCVVDGCLVRVTLSGDLVAVGSRASDVEEAEKNLAARRAVTVREPTSSLARYPDGARVHCTTAGGCASTEVYGIEWCRDGVLRLLGD